jgi:GT2 family glycosyltransferase
VRTTVVIPTYQRRDPVVRLVRALADQVRADNDLASSVDIHVVVDGSDDGTVEALRALDVSPVALRWSWQPNRGQSAARNAGLETVEHDGVVWFLDDDMMPSDGLVAAHAGAHDGATHVVMGPCLFPESRRVVGMNRRWADEVFRELSATGTVTSATYFSVANTSARAELWKGVGRQHEGFVGWGGEDFELGVRLLAAGTPIVYDVAAIAWHEQERSLRAMCRTKEEEGANRVRLVELHPDQLDVLLPWRRPSRLHRLLRPLRRSPRALRTVARILAVAATAEHRIFRDRRRLVFSAAVGTALVAGVATADRDGQLIQRLLDDPPPVPRTR